MRYSEFKIINVTKRSPTNARKLVSFIFGLIVYNTTRRALVSFTTVMIIITVTTIKLKKKKH